jgi:HemY protein
MLRALLFIVIAAVAVGVAWLVAAIPGHITASFGAMTIETTAPVAILVAVVIAGLLLLIWHVCGWLLSLPDRGGRWRGHRRQRLGDQATTRLLVALAADDKREAWREANRTRRLLGESPYSLLLFAEAGRVSGRDAEADKAFRALAARKDARFLGLRGLLRQAMAQENWTEASKIAKQAEDARPGTNWLRQERAELALKTDNWAEVLELTSVSDRKAEYYVAAADAEPDAARALSLSKKAWELDPAFQPAVLRYAQRLRTSGHERRAQAVVLKAWKASPHPQLAEFALATQPDASARVRAAERLAAANPTNPESNLLMAREALDSGAVADARKYVDRLQADGFNQRRMYLLKSEIEELERGDTEDGRLAQREALRQAATAASDSRWQCSACRTDASEWKPKCPVCQSVGTINWVSTDGSGSLPAIAPPIVEQGSVV